MKERNVVLRIVLTLVTCGLYGLYWMAVVTNDVHRLTGKPRTTSGGRAALYTLLTCTVYFYYWLYQIGGELADYRRDQGLTADAVSRMTYTVIAVIMTLAPILSEFLRVLAQIGHEAGSSPSIVGDITYSNGAVLDMLTGVFLAVVFTAVFQFLLTIVILWFNYHRRDGSPQVLYVLMGVLRTSIFTTAFLQISLNDMIRHMALDPGRTHCEQKAGGEVQ